MAQNALTVTPPNPTPPTNFTSTGATPPNVPNFTKNTYADPKNWSYINPKDFPPPYFDDGSAGPLTTFAANTAALASGSGATAGGTDGTYPGAGTGYTTVNNVGPVPASSSVAHEGAGTETSVLAPGSRPECPTVSCGTGPNQTAATLAAGPNASHASSLSGTAVPTLSGATGANNVHPGVTVLTATGTNFNRGSVINIAGVPYQTNYVSATSLTVTNAPKPNAGSIPVTVTSNGVTTAPQNWVIT